MRAYIKTVAWLLFCLVNISVEAVAQEEANTPEPVPNVASTPDGLLVAATTILEPLVIEPSVNDPNSPTAAILLRPLSFDETKATSLAESERNRYAPMTIGKNGKIVYHFGESIASVITAVKNITDIELEIDEIIVDGGLFLGDTINWEVVPIVQRKDASLVTHIIVKPHFADIETTMTVLTNRRTYYFYLRATSDRYMSAVGFNYSQELSGALSRYKQSIESATTGTAGELDFDYVLTSNKPSWLPQRVYSDENKTYIQMPRLMPHGEAPIFLLLGVSGQQQIVNYRLKGSTYIVDWLVEEGLLITGVGRKQEFVKIKYSGSNRG